MKEILITKQQIAQAEIRLNKFSFNIDRGLSMFGSEKDRTLIGYLGEQIIMDYLSLSNSQETFEYDLMYKGKKLEVKSISCKFKPYLHYLCTVNSFNLSGVHKQQADYYIFLRILNDKSKAWILGYIPCSVFWEKGKYVEKGTEILKGITFSKANATVMEISQLLDIDDLLNL